jgi:hypothetical protein
LKKNFVRFLPALVICIITVTLALAACQPTPTEDAVVNKGEGQLEDMIEASPAEEKPLEVPATLHVDSFGTDEFQVAVDADVIVPDAARYPVVEIEQREFSADWMRTLMQSMSDGKPIFTYENETPQTKGEILVEIASLQDMLANPENYLPNGVSDEIRSERSLSGKNRWTPGRRHIRRRRIFLKRKKSICRPTHSLLWDRSRELLTLVKAGKRI